MELMIKIKEIQYSDVAAMAMPILGKSFSNRADAVAMAAATASRLPERLIRELFDEITDSRMSVILSAFAMENKNKIIFAVNKLSSKNDFGVTIADFVITPQLEIRVRIGKIDYPCIVKRFLPMIKEKLLGMGGAAALLCPVIRNASADQICGLLDTLLGSNKEEFIAALVNQYGGKLVSAIEDFATKQNIHLKVEEIQAHA